MIDSSFSEIPVPTSILFRTFFGLSAIFFLAITAQKLSAQAKSDTLRALIVFTQFLDDTFAGDPNVNRREWPLFENPTTLPAFAKHILAPTPSPPFPDSSLTDYFYRQSNGQFVLYGDVYDSVLVSLHPEDRYHRGQGGYGDLTAELLDRIDQYGFDFSKYDENRDGLLDHVFIVIRGDSKRDAKRFVWTGASCLDARCSGTLAGGGPREPPSYDGVKVDWDLSGSIIMHRTPGNIIPLVYHVRLMAHELGHDLWAKHFVHIPSLPRNDIPERHNRGRGQECIGYVLMAGSGGAQDCQGSQTISAFERDLLDWISCTPLRRSQKNISLGDLYTTSDCYTVQLSDEPRNRRIYLSNLQRIGYFDRLRLGGVRRQFNMGLLRTTGLLAMLADDERVDVMAADNTVQLAMNNAAYFGDLFGPSTQKQLTPWTRPNINGYNKYPQRFNPSWFAVDNIRYAGDASRTLLFDFYEDFREAPIIREDSWFGHELDGYIFKNKVTVTDRSTLTISGNVSISGELNIDAGSRIVIAEGAEVHLLDSSTIRMGLGSQISVEGLLVLNGLVQRHGNAVIRVSESGKIQSSLD